MMKKMVLISLILATHLLLCTQSNFEKYSDDEIFYKIENLNSSLAKHTLQRVYNEFIKPGKELPANVVAEIGRPNFRHNIEASLLFIILTLDYNLSTPASKREAILSIINIRSGPFLMKTKSDSVIFKSYRTDLIYQLKKSVKSDQEILQHQAASVLVVLGENKNDYIQIFEKLSKGLNKENWNLDGTGLFGHGDNYKGYVRDGWDINEIKECARNEIRIEAFKTLINLDKDKAFKIADYIINDEKIDLVINEKLSYQYHNLKAAISKIVNKRVEKEKN